MPKNKEIVKLVKRMKAGEKLYLRCRSCGEKWYPDARRWRTKNPNAEKILYCPNCNIKNKVPRAVVNALIEQARKEVEYGFDEG